MTIKEDKRLNNTERNINEELLINTKNKAGKLTESQWNSQKRRNEMSKRLEELEEKLGGG